MVRVKRCFKGKRDFEGWLLGKANSSQIRKLRLEGRKKKIDASTIDKAWVQFRKAKIIRRC